MKIIKGEKYKCVNSEKWATFNEGEFYDCNLDGTLTNIFKEKISIEEINSKDFSLVERGIKIIKGNWYECVNAEGWFGQFKVGNKYFSNENEELYAEGNYNQDVSTNIKDFKIITSTPAHYDNTNGSLYKFCEDQKLNSYEFDLIKRIMRCRKKGQFQADLQSTKVLIDLYLKEYETD